MPEHFVVIIAGGRGERFWPQSRLHRPKHLLPIVGQTPLLAQTLARVRPLVSARNTFVITGAISGGTISVSSGKSARLGRSYSARILRNCAGFRYANTLCASKKSGKPRSFKRARRN